MNLKIADDIPAPNTYDILEKAKSSTGFSFGISRE